MPNVTLEIPDHMRGTVRMGLENSAATLRQAIDKASTETMTVSLADDLATWSGMVVWLDQAAGKLK
jgi:hypothetical protein